MFYAFVTSEPLKEKQITHRIAGHTNAKRINSLCMYGVFDCVEEVFVLRNASELYLNNDEAASPWQPFYGGKLHRVSAEVKNTTGAQLCKVSGEWNGIYEFVYSDVSWRKDF